jgi:catechol 2,3-dioxygenase-like lactoylglutathione lyase family enzyme
MDNVGIIVNDIKAAVAFFGELGLELVGEMIVEGQWVDRVVELNGVRSDIALLRIPDGHSQLELSVLNCSKSYMCTKKTRILSENPQE